MSTPQWSKFEAALSKPRLQPYLSSANENQELAISLYRWNLELSVAFLEILAPTEVIVRNAIDRELRLWNKSRKKPGGIFYSENWTSDPAPQLSMLKNALKNAQDQAQKSARSRAVSHPRCNSNVNHNDVLAQLTFGTWHRLLPSSQPDNKRKQLLWNHALVKAFPFAAGNSVDQILRVSGEQMVYSRLRNLSQLRNRAAHMEPLLEVKVNQRLKDVLDLIHYVDPGMYDWVKGMSRVAAVNSRRPVVPEQKTSTASANP
ncbi:Abi family protein [Corynebacterium ulcerans]|uniref:Abi family protein n=1 Tax=Corynebacterium ulcerans TaxID=65058 RepID=UPI0018D77F7A|nr:Abi family protein [Corynebacterium ulcerans]MBH5297509.1 Abi family protein [Corynebacterium ulcerans]